jgi:uncharacterized protein
MSRVHHFEINADDLERAKKFYEAVFNWKIAKWNGPVEYWNIQTGDSTLPGIDGGLQKRDDLEATNQNFINVSSIEEFMQKVKDRGGTVISPKISIPSVGYCSYFKDTEENLSAMMQWDKNVQ